MKKRITALTLIVLITLFSGKISNTTDDAKALEEEVVTEASVVELIVPEEEFSVEKISSFYDANLMSYSLEELEYLINIEETNQEAAHSLAEAARLLGWPESSDSIVSAKAEWWNAQLAIDLYDSRYQELYTASEKRKWDTRKEEYPEATEIWLYMKSLGWNDYVCAGIMGNLMAEVGGNTLKIQYWLYDSDKNYYGMCQWSSGYREIWDANLTDQCIFLKDTIKYELDTFGYAYMKGFNFTAFLNLSDEREAAKAFAKCYERCASYTYEVRQDNAEKAYNYFVKN